MCRNGKKKQGSPRNPKPRKLYMSYVFCSFSLISFPCHLSLVGSPWTPPKNIKKPMSSVPSVHIHKHVSWGVVKFCFDGSNHQGRWTVSHLLIKGTGSIINMYNNPPKERKISNLPRFYYKWCTSIETRAWFVAKTRRSGFQVVENWIGMRSEQSITSGFMFCGLFTTYIFQGKHWFWSFKRYKAQFPKLTFGFQNIWVHQVCASAREGPRA